MSAREPSWTEYAAVTPNDATPNVFEALFVGTAGTLKVTRPGGTTVTFGAVPAGTLLRIQTTLVWATGTSASNIVGMVR